ncbi:HAD-superfamily hydrolase, subfamily IG,5'-nucleotidase [Ostreococcus tauri]|uniref:HAD-superfamily hydrolase, subfamily IG,5'-nucleotidase n=1 Tax=Ostreococcus tauri TaxID=70448 RepID=A0A090N4E4_OSTTA|nr:HAD-superfamily hydrolase, subfamily IG,5'-nucleotidase [Ostreococcus tauri]CEF99723.1 HAD-superfamily hydrolase, subfamily IG,5'-nucleotidase [Ostreococcus tauri]|eukprot:XP_022839994.1 HAD-superfamily hydrolase, subfamily IG,5'-nucleotidase [Ostreococcus tauri]
MKERTMGRNDVRERASATHVSNLSAAAARELKHWSATSEAERNDQAATKVFCNRSLNMKRIDAIGFDMDYTLAMYKPETFEMMSYEETVKKLGSEYGYPSEVLREFTFDPHYMVRGLVVDKKRGNILKMDRHNYVKVAYHGFSALATDERLATYCETSNRPSFDGPAFSALDTLFSMGEAYLFSQLVEAKDLGKFSDFFDGKSYMQMYDEIRAAVDLCHRDGSLKQAVAENPERYIAKDDGLVPLLKGLRASGKQVFLLTNSLWDYSNVVMNYIIDGHVGDAKTLDWLNLFDVVITGSSKPGFFANDSSTIFEVDTKTGHLRNTDNGAPLTPIGSVQDVTHKRALARGLSVVGAGPARVYQGGSYTHLHAMLGIEFGSRLLYVGDHIYGDILRAKKQIDWRTMLIVPELAHEIEILEANKEKPHALRRLRTLRDALDDQVARHSWLAEQTDDSAKNKAELQRAQQLSDAARTAHREGMRAYHREFHYVWGQLMKAGSQNSRFAFQVERYACLYTSHVRNLWGYSPQKVFRAASDYAPHDLDTDEDFHDFDAAALTDPASTIE